MASPSLIVPVLAGVLAVGSWSWALLSSFEPPEPGRPRIAADPIVRLEARGPRIGEFASYDINHENPFVPWLQREGEKQRKSQERKPRTKTGPVAEQPPAPELPKIEPAALDIPQCQGILVIRGQAHVLGIMPGELTPRWIAAGTVVGDWRFERIEGGTTTVWTQVSRNSTLLLTVTPDLSRTRPVASTPAASGQPPNAEAPPQAEGTSETPATKSRGRPTPPTEPALQAGPDPAPPRRLPRRRDPVEEQLP